jgi:hypothetical protein
MTFSYCMVLTSWFYFMRSQNCTYAIEAAKNAMVTAIQRTSCMGTLPCRFLDPVPLKSDYFSLAASGRNCFRLNIHFYEFASPGRIELRKVNLYRRGRTHPVSQQSCQDAQQKCHRTDAQ